MACDWYGGIKEKWGGRFLDGNTDVGMPSMIAFRNIIPAIEMLRRHLKTESCVGDSILIHCDVDMDGIGSGYILRSFIKQTSMSYVQYTINKGKEHGIKQRHVDYLAKHPVDLFVVVDSSCNCLESISQFNCDVLVIDHHEVLTNGPFTGKTDDGHDYVIVNNMLLGDVIEYKALRSMIKSEDDRNMLQEYREVDEAMSCGLVVYEILRVYEAVYGNEHVSHALKLYQWAGVTLITDSISLLNDRNQWYINNTMGVYDLEVTLKELMNCLDHWSATLSKSFISYTLAPTFNRAIRANANMDAASIVMSQPRSIELLKCYREAQDSAIQAGIKYYEERDNFSFVDLSGKGIDKNYCGVIASRVCGLSKKDTVAFNVRDGIARGSFRAYRDIKNFRKNFADFASLLKDPRITSSGHSYAFGFEAPYELLVDVIMPNLNTTSEKPIPYLSVGYMNGQYKVDSVEEFKRAMGFMILGIGNARVATKEQIELYCDSSEATLVQERGKLRMYDIFGMQCKAFQDLEPGPVRIYAEQANALEVYVKQ